MMGPFRVGVIFGVKSKHLANSLEALGALTIPDAPIIDGCGHFEFESQVAQHPGEVKALVSSKRSEVGAFIVVSDDFVRYTGSRYETTANATELRDWFNHDDQHGCVGDLLALVEGPCQRTNDVTGMIDCRRELLLRELQRVANGLWLKSTVDVVEDRDDSDAVRIQFAPSYDEMVQACHLRFQVYDALGYLEPEVYNRCGNRDVTRSTKLSEPQLYG
jgi:hypothetical protein